MIGRSSISLARREPLGLRKRELADRNRKARSDPDRLPVLASQSPVFQALRFYGTRTEATDLVL